MRLERFAAVLTAAFFSSGALRAAEFPEWDRLAAQKGCLISAADVDFTIEGSLFEKKDWQLFFASAGKDERIFQALVGRFPSRRPTAIHICNFGNATEGEAAVFAAQQIVKRNWHAYDGDNEKIRRTARMNAASRAPLLKNVLSDKASCAELQRYFMKLYKSGKPMPVRKSSDGTAENF